MHVSGFMVPRDKVATVDPDDTLQTAMEALMGKKIGCLVVVQNDFTMTPMGIVTSRDLVRAYQQAMPAAETKVRQLMKTELVAVRDTESRDQAARSLEQHKNHHAIVVNGDNEFVGLISSLDLVVEMVKDDRAYPWNRSDDGKFHKPQQEGQEQASSSPRSTTHRESHTFIDYVDSVRGLPFMDD